MTNLCENEPPTERAIIRGGWRLIFSLKTYVFAEICDGLAIIRDGWRLIFSLKT